MRGKVIWMSMVMVLSLQANWGVSIGSQHTTENPRQKMNPVNPGIIYYGEDGYKTGVYKNSDRKITLFVGKDWKYGTWGDEFDYGMSLVAATGYEPYPIVPIPTFWVKHESGFRIDMAPYKPKAMGWYVLWYRLRIELRVLMGLVSIIFN